MGINIDKLNVRLAGFRVLKSAEVDILADGKLDYSDALLKELDFTICSIHSRFGLNKTEQTAGQFASQSQSTSDWKDPGRPTPGGCPRPHEPQHHHCHEHCSHHKQDSWE